MPHGVLHRTWEIGGEDAHAEDREILREFAERRPELISDPEKFLVEWLAEDDIPIAKDVAERIAAAKNERARRERKLN